MCSLQEKLKNIMISSLDKSTYNQSICPKCKNTGWVIVKDGGQGTAKECDCGIIKKNIHDGKLRFANIPDGFKDATLENFRKSVYIEVESQRKIAEIAKVVCYWIDNFDKMKKGGIGLYLYSGTKGSGKTRLAVSIANHLINKNNVQVKFSTSVQILEEISKTWNDRERSESKLIQELNNVDVLVIDDFGAENIKGWVNEKFYSIINGRYANKKITIFTSNMSIDDLFYDDRITNRIKERALPIPFPEESVRDFLAKELKTEFLKEICKDK